MGNMTHDAVVAVTQPDALQPPRRWYTPLLAGDLAALWPAIVALFVLVLAIAFGLSFHGLYTFGDRIMGWNKVLCGMAPIGLDVFSLIALLATFLTHDAPWRVRLYCWMAFGVTVALSVAGNAVAALAAFDPVASLAGDHFRWGYRQVSAIVWAAIWPALSAGALHVLIVVRRHLDRKRDKIDQVADVARKAEAAEQLLRARAIELAATGATAAAILDELDLEPGKRRTVERWTEPIRAAMSNGKAPAPAKTTTRRTP